MKKMMEKIKKCNRTVLELHLGILLWGIVWQAAGVWFVKDKVLYSSGLWIGIGTAMLAGYHMWRTLDRAFDGFEGDVSRKMITANVIRYVVIVIVFAIVAVTKTGNVLMTFCGIMGLKVAAYIQPFTHKFTNKIFHEHEIEEKEVIE